MARILFISLYDINAEGLRIMSSILKMENHEPHIIFLKTLRRGPVRYPETDWIGIGENGRSFQHASGSPISKKEEDILINTIRNIDPDLIGFSVCSPIVPYVNYLSKKIRKLFSTPLIWGGPHATMRPGDCVDYCDFVCVGEADSIISQIACHLDNGLDLGGITGLTFASEYSATMLQPSPLIQDLDRLPFKDISPTNKYLIENNSLKTNFSRFSYSGNYHIISSRGCLFRCTYCCEHAFRRLYSPIKFLRRRSVENVVAEIKHAQELFSFRLVHFEDETFSFNESWLETFRALYKQEIAMPFICYIYPIRGIEKQIGILKDAGLISTVLSLLSGSERINKTIFRRPYDKERFLACARLLHAKKIMYSTDIITNNPFETEQDLIDTLNVLRELPKPFWLDVNKLYVLKDTEIEKIIDTLNPIEHVSEKLFSLYARLFWLTRFNNYVARLAGYIRSLSIVRKAPFLVNPYLINLPYIIIDKIFVRRRIS